MTIRNGISRIWFAAVLAAVLVLAHAGAAFAAGSDAGEPGSIGGVPANMVMISAIVGFVMPALIAAINRVRWSPTIKALVAFGVSIVAGGITAWVEGDISNRTDRTTAVIIVFFVAISTYEKWWKPSLIAPKIEQNI